MIVELGLIAVAFLGGYKWGATVKAEALANLQQAEASAEAELANLKAKIASSAKAVVPAVVAEVKAAL